MFAQRILFLTVLALVHAASEKAGFVGTFSGGSEGGLQGTVTVRDANTLVVEGYTLADASAPALYWWGATDSDLSSGFRISEKQVTETAEDIKLQISLDSGKTVAAFSTVGLWCERYGVNYGQATLKANSGNGNTTTSNGGSPTSNGSSPTPNGGSNTTPNGGNGTSTSPSKAASTSSTIRPILSDQYTTARVYFFSILGLLFLESVMHLSVYLITIFKRGQY